ncbi:DNA repair protein rad8 [Achaetomium macrosporum]|uniref:DNA repair protein rad8 n=1 Tax=Achaetomium macrosporum TaxID=79813 RepID=A0AAN7CE16_9PEZI|nr:DNA repair protein rad8 [Achaetomium macrosporum]
MLPTELLRYVAAGCLILDKADLEDRLADNIWSSVKPGEWHHFLPLSALDKGEGLDGLIGYSSPDKIGKSTFLFLTPEIQTRLISSVGPLSSLSGLLLNRWIHMSLGTSTNNPDLAIVRVYLLPDDVDNRSIPRFAPDLRRARATLLQHLDFSTNTWQGQVSETAEEQVGESQSLLQMFNIIPSPDPSPEDILDFDARDAAYRLMDSNVPGLLTTLYSYQRRSAALMLQRESQTMQVVDPRLTKVADQLGSQWYYDAVRGTILREPVHYDEPRGGILAEEMGAGKTLICLALILASRHIPSAVPDHLRTDEPVVRPRVGSLADMAAACITRNSVPWRAILDGLGPEDSEYRGCVDAIRRNPGFYRLPPPTRHRRTRQPDSNVRPRRVLLSHTSLVIVPTNLVQQWKQEITKHTTGLRVFIVDKKQELPAAEELIEYDILLFASSRFERLAECFGSNSNCVHVLLNSSLERLAMIHFKRCIVDEGHKLGNSRARRRSNLHLIIDHLQISSKWVVTGTPSKGLFGVDDTHVSQPDGQQQPAGTQQTESSADLEMGDLQRIGSIARFFLHMRPWANKSTEPGDTPADWNIYVMQPRHSARSAGSQECLKATLASLIIRHRLSEVSDLLPTVDEKIVYLDGSFQDQLVLNLFSMMIIFNAVQSQRTDQDYFFHPRQRKALVELVLNLRQASFFGGSFFSAAQIRKAIDTAEDFLREGKVPVSPEDESLLRDAVEFGHLAVENNIKNCANQFREVPLYVQNFPWGAGREWSLDLEDGDPVCTDSRLISALQKFVQPLVDAPTSLQMMFDSGRFAERGLAERLKGLEDQDPDGDPPTPKTQQKTLAGNTQLGQDNTSPNRRRSVILAKDLPAPGGAFVAAEAERITIAAPLAGAQLISTASAKLSYLVDQILKYQESEQIIVFYENDNVAYYLAGVLEILQLQIQHLIYAKGLTPERRAQYVATFNHNPKFRVLLMDVGQAAFGLDMQSASRIYFINPVLNPQVEAQAIGRARRISQNKPVSVETLVLRGSVEEVIVKRRGEMTQAEQWKCRSILDDKPIYEWILNAKILPLPGGNDIPGPDQMAKLQSPQFIFGRGFGRELSHPDQDLLTVNGSPVSNKKSVAIAERSRKRPSPEAGFAVPVGTPLCGDGPPMKRRPQVRFPDFDNEEDGRLVSD